MKLLLCIPSLADVEETLKHFTAATQRDEKLPFVHHAAILHHQVTLCETGVGCFQTAYKVTKALNLQRYHLALKVALCNAYKERDDVGTVLNIVNEKPGDFGSWVNGEWKDYYDLGLMTATDFPQQRGGFVNLNNAYMNVLLPFRKAVGVTVNDYANAATFQTRAAKYKADAESGDGLGFVYACMAEGQNYYQLNIVERNMATAVVDLPLAQQRMSDLFIDLLAKL